MSTLIDSDFSIKPLALAVIELAVREARKGDSSATHWLYSDGILWIDAITDIHPDYVRRWLDRELKPKPRARKPARIATGSPGTKKS
jgi:hypothetical protein